MKEFLGFRKKLTIHWDKTIFKHSWQILTFVLDFFFGLDMIWTLWCLTQNCFKWCLIQMYLFVYTLRLVTPTVQQIQNKYSHNLILFSDKIRNSFKFIFTRRQFFINSIPRFFDRIYSCLFNGFISCLFKCFFCYWMHFSNCYLRSPCSGWFRHDSDQSSVSKQWFILTQTETKIVCLEIIQKHRWF